MNRAAMTDKPILTVDYTHPTPAQAEMQAERTRLQDRLLYCQISAGVAIDEGEFEEAEAMQAEIVELESSIARLS